MGWDKVCSPKNEGGLGLRDLELFNAALLAKWRWRLLSNPNRLWCRILHSRYGDLPFFRSQANQGGWKNCSTLWKDLWKVSNCVKGINKDWFDKGVRKIIGNDQKTSFWNEPWVGDRILGNDFSRLYSVSISKEALISDMGFFENGKWV